MHFCCRETQTKGNIQRFLTHLLFMSHKFFSSAAMPTYIRTLRLSVFFPNCDTIMLLMFTLQWWQPCSSSWYTNYPCWMVSSIQPCQFLIQNIDFFSSFIYFFYCCCFLFGFCICCWAKYLFPADHSLVVSSFPALEEHDPVQPQQTSGEQSGCKCVSGIHYW